MSNPLLFNPAYYRRQAIVLRTEALAQLDAVRRSDCLKLADHFEALATDIQAWAMEKSVASQLLRLF